MCSHNKNIKEVLSQIPAQSGLHSQTCISPGSHDFIEVAHGFVHIGSINAKRSIFSVKNRSVPLFGRSAMHSKLGAGDPRCVHALGLILPGRRLA
jgi:hypothetical protein